VFILADIFVNSFDCIFLSSILLASARSITIHLHFAAWYSKLQKLFQQAYLSMFKRIKRKSWGTNTFFIISKRLRFRAPHSRGGFVHEFETGFDPRKA
jgi:hypothetical protein